MNTQELPDNWQAQLAGELADMAATTSRLNKLAARKQAPTCKRCHEPASAHCPDCSACPEQDCPAWREPEED